MEKTISPTILNWKTRFIMLALLALVSWFIYEKLNVIATNSTAPLSSQVSTIHTSSETHNLQNSVIIQATQKNSQAILDFAKGLRSQYSSNIANPSMQIDLLEKLMAHCKKENIENCQAYLQSILAEAFPQMFEHLQDRLNALMNYHTWGNELHAHLNLLSDVARRQILWEKRHELFGEDADIIWASELQNHQLQQHIAMLDADYSLTLPEKLNSYQTGLNHIYKENAQVEIKNNQQQLVNQFLTMDSVQQQLQELSKAQQLETLTEIRHTMGMEEAAIDRWQTLDESRSERWQTGQAYMQARASLVSDTPSEELEAKLEDLRGQHFGENSSHIKAEEENGYYRFAGQQILGLN